jgi:acyl carrier protein
LIDVTAAIEDHKQDIRDVVCEILEIEPGELHDGDDFRADHDADSMGVIEILAALEMRFDISIDQAHLPTMGNLAGVYDAVAKAAGWE